MSFCIYVYLYESGMVGNFMTMRMYFMYLHVGAVSFCGAETGHVIRVPENWKLGPVSQTK